MLFNAKAILLEEQFWYYLTHSLEDKGVHTFLKGICPKVNVIPRLEYELAFNDSAVHCIFPSLKQNFIAYRSSKMSDCIFEIHQLWQSGFSRVYSNCCCSCLFEPEIIKIGQSSQNSVCYCYISYEITDQFLWFQVKMNSYCSNWNTPY